MEYVTTDVNSADQTVIHWFATGEGENYGYCKTEGEDPCLLDSDGCRVEPCNDHDSVFDMLEKLVIAI